MPEADRILFPGLSAAPLAVAYLVLPLVLALAALWEAPAPAGVTGPGIGSLWLGLAWLGLFTCLVVRPGGPRPAPTLANALLLGVCTALLFAYVAPLVRGFTAAGPFIPELRPLAHLLLAWLWIRTFGPPPRRAFALFGGLLGLFCLADALGASLMAGRLTASARFGGPDVQSCLLLVALAAGPLALGREDMNRMARLCMVFILAGVGACLSAPALFVGGWVFLFFGPAPRAVRIPVFVLALLLLASGRASPEDAGLLTGFKTAWQARDVLLAFLAEPSRLLTGFPLDATLPLPAGVRPPQAGGPQPSPPFALIPFWPHVAAAWGLPGTILAAGLMLRPALRRPSPSTAALAACLLAMGLSMELMYNGPIATASALALFSPLRPNAAQKEVFS